MEEMQAAVGTKPLLPVVFWGECEIVTQYSPSMVTFATSFTNF
jgi:hypothetical protein